MVEANVGMNLIVSKGEIVAYKWGSDQITTAAIEVPAAPSAAAARAHEAEYLALQAPGDGTSVRRNVEASGGGTKPARTRGPGRTDRRSA